VVVVVVPPGDEEDLEIELRLLKNITVALP